MTKLTRTAAVAASAAAVFALAACAAHYRSGMPAADVIRKLSGLRLALELYRQERRALPPSYAAVTESGKLEAVPRLKLKGHRASSLVADSPSFLIRDTGGWVYVNAAGPDSGLVYIDCTHFDEKGRPWSEF